MSVARAVVVPENGGPEVLRVEERSVPEPGAGQLLVEVAASGVNFVDVYRRQGVYPVPTPFVLGEECAGRVVAVGPDVPSVQVGDVVATAAGGHGTHTNLAVIDAARAVPVPRGLDPQLAAAAMLQGITAHYLLNSTYPVRSGETVLVHAAAGGVGQLLVQLAKAKGARVIGTVGSSAKADVARAVGADDVVRYDEVGDLAGAVRELVLFGAASGQVPPFDLQRLNPLGSLFVTRPTIAHYTADRDELSWRAKEVLGAVADGTLRVEIGGRYGLDDAAQAYRDLEGRRTTGKLLIVT
jgi:NADPH2:quinone reductase